MFLRRDFRHGNATTADDDHRIRYVRTLSARFATRAAFMLPGSELFVRVRYLQHRLEYAVVVWRQTLSQFFSDRFST